MPSTPPGDTDQAGQAVHGHVDGVCRGLVTGWCWDPAQPSRRLRVQVQVDGVPVVEAPAQLARPDLRAAGIGDGGYAFRIMLPDRVNDGRHHRIDILADGRPLIGSPVWRWLPEPAITPLPADGTAYAHDLAVCAIAKNEGPYLLEWIAHHHVVGVGRFLIFDNDSSDDTAALLAPLEALGLVERVPWPTRPGEVPQLAAYADGIRRLRGLARWIAFIDLDEFLNPLVDPDLPTLLRRYPDVAALVVPWRLFGSSGRRTYDDQPVTRRFTRRGHEGHQHMVKTIARSRFLAGMHVHTPTVTQGSVVDEHRIIAGSRGPAAHHPVPNAERLVLNHYFCKSFEEWERKRNRGRADKKAGSTEHIRRQEDFDAHDVNEVEDRSILRFDAAVQARLADFAAGRLHP